ncbi:MAG: aspartyl/glutamyl-tRNA amidotransferase subunit A [Patescibacteria group bacterium]|nr:aspartyl/glutamyl-tRNA amidotransferase subunit A [Patescibacteria group bacterium]
MKFHRLTLKEAIKKIKNKEVSPKEIHDDVHAIIREKNNNLHVYLSIDEHSHETSNPQTRLAGLPIAVKDNFLTVGLPTTASSRVLERFYAPYESTVTRRIKEAGGVIIGKTNLDAWAHGSSTETSDFGTTKNPDNPEYSPGGSSGGSAAAVSADMCIAAIGSETAGSIRIPASWCGCVGLKPTYGRVSRYGIIAMGSSLDCPGPMTKTVEDSAFLLEIMAGKDPYDATTTDHKVPRYTEVLAKGVKGMKIGIIYMDHPQMPEEVRKAIHQAGKLFESHGAFVDEIPLSQTLEENKILSPDYAIAVYTVVQRSEVSSNLARYDGIRFGRDRSYFGNEARRRIILGTFTLSKGYADKYYLQAQRVRHLYKKNFDQLFSSYDLLISTPSPGYALKIGASEGNPMFGEMVDMLNEPSSLSGHPAISIPCYRDPKTNVCLGLSIIGDHFAEEKILQAAYLYEQETPWNRWVSHQKE